MNDISMNMDYSTLQMAAATNPQHPRFKSEDPIGNQMVHDATEIAAVLGAVEPTANILSPKNTLHIRINDRGGRGLDFFFTYPCFHQTRTPVLVEHPF